MRERLQAIFPNFPEGIVIDGKDDGTEPDFFVEQSNALLGIELTEMYREAEPTNERCSLMKVSKSKSSIGWRIFRTERRANSRVCVHFSMNEEWAKKSDCV